MVATVLAKNSGTLNNDFSKIHFSISSELLFIGNVVNRFRSEKWPAVPTN